MKWILIVTLAESESSDINLVIAKGPDASGLSTVSSTAGNTSLEVDSDDQTAAPAEGILNLA